MAKKGIGSKKGLNNSIVWIVGGLSVAGFFAYQTNIGGFKDTISKTFAQLQQTLSSVFPGSLLIKSQTSTQQYPFNYPYPPTQQPQYAGPTTLSAAHYEMAGTPNLGIQGAGLLPNPNLWVPQGGITSNRVADPYAAINYGPYSATPTQFANQYYNIQDTNLQQPFIQGPIAPSPCPAGEYRAGDGRCYPLPSPPPEACPDGSYRASDGKCYAMVPGMPVGDCPGGYVKGSDGVCRQSIVCPAGYRYEDGVCKSTTTTPPPATCPSGTTLVNGVCVPPPSIPIPTGSFPFPTGGRFTLFKALAPGESPNNYTPARLRANPSPINVRNWMVLIRRPEFPIHPSIITSLSPYAILMEVANEYSRDWAVSTFSFGPVNMHSHLQLYMYMPAPGGQSFFGGITMVNNRKPRRKFNRKR